MRVRSRVMWAGVAIAVAVALAVVMHRWPQMNAPGARPDAHTESSSQASERPADSSDGNNPLTAEAEIARLRSVAEQIRSTTDPAEIHQILVRLRAELIAMPKDVAIAAIREFLRGREDVGTKLGFTVGKGGVLTDAPSLRVWLLDCLGEIDRATAAEYAPYLLATPASADEWAVSLRDYAMSKTGPADVAFVQQKMRELISNATWQAEPSAGYLECFDTIVYLKDAGFTPTLVSLIGKKDNRAVAHAAYLTLDRLVLAAPREVLRQISANDSAMAERAQTRANYLARADVSDPEQRQIVESYLLSPDRSEQELNTFAGLYPNANLMISNNLLTETKVPEQAAVAARDREALLVVDQWLKDARFEPIRSYVEVIRERLAGFVQQSEGPHQGLRP